MRTPERKSRPCKGGSDLCLPASDQVYRYPNTASQSIREAMVSDRCHTQGLVDMNIAHLLITAHRAIQTMQLNGDWRAFCFSDQCTDTIQMARVSLSDVIETLENCDLHNEIPITSAVRGEAAA